MSYDHIRAQYHEHGYAIVENAISNKELRDVKLASDIELSKNHDSNINDNFASKSYREIVNQKVNVWRTNTTLYSLAIHPKIITIVKNLMGTKYIRLFQDQILVKPAQTGKATLWHQDLNIWPFEDPRALTVWIPLQAVNKDNGCLQFLPGSHKLGKISKFNLQSQNKPLDSCDVNPFVAALDAGSLHIHNSLTIHYAFKNISNTARYAYAIVYIPYDITASKNHYFLNRNIKEGDQFMNPDYPLL